LTLEAHLIETLADISSAEWNALAGQQPFLQHSFLFGLEQTGCVGEGTGWNPQYLVIKEEGEMKAAAPLYVKEHSYGEFVFDWAWARAYEQHGEPYYPKLLCAIPFSPISGPRLLVKEKSFRPIVAETLMTLASRLACSTMRRAW
jgi:predicted N-acyltransferase